MAPNPRVKEAFRAMKAIGISESQVKPVLKRLLQLYDRNWELIEEENYRVLADAIFDADDSKGADTGDEAEVHDEPEQPLKRSRTRGQNDQNSSFSDNSSPMALKKPKLEENVQGHISPQSQGNSTEKKLSTPAGSGGPQVRPSYKGKEPMVPQVVTREKRPMVQKALQIKENAVNPRVVQQPKQKVPGTPLIVPKDEPYTDDEPHYMAPLSVVMPGSSNKESIAGRRASAGNPNVQVPPAPHLDRDENLAAKSQVSVIPEASQTKMEIASGKVKISLSCETPNFRVPSQEELLKSMEEKCLRSYKILDPNFSIKQLLKDMCECFLELGTHSSHESEENLVHVTPSIDVLKKSAARSVLGGGNGPNFLPGNITNGSVGIHHFVDPSALQIQRQLQHFNWEMHPQVNGTVQSNGVRELVDPNSHSLVVVPQHELTLDEIRSLHDFNDLTKGEENVQIAWLNEINNECPPSFHYIPENLIYQNANVKFSLSQIKAEDCCPTCVGDCLSSTSVCVCASETEDLYAYTTDGLLREDFLDECITMTRDPQHQCLSYCKACPFERSKNDEILEPCKGHLNRKYIKECWSKCACHKQCGNRVVQRGIRHKLQVFFTPEGKGWGLRTLEKLPRGTFVCEYVGEILTNKELYERNMQKMRGTNDRHIHPLLLDAYWFLKGALKDDEALCLDATFYGNVARFINHRCLDANLIEIPVKIETSDDHYYHVAFFTTRDVDVLEELTWDYGIDFDDNDQPVKVFRCLCGSKFCRNMKRSNRSKSLSR